jgi:hypothetical protein
VIEVGAMSEIYRPASGAEPQSSYNTVLLVSHVSEPHGDFPLAKVVPRVTEICL